MYRKTIIGIIATVFSFSTISNALLASSTSKVTKRAFHETPLYKHIIEKTEKDLADFYAKEKSLEQKQDKTMQEQKKEDIIPTDKVNKPANDLEKKLANKPARNPTYRPAYGFDPSTFKPDMPFDEALNILRNATEPRLNIVVLWKDLENAGIYGDTPIGIDGVSGIPLGMQLELLLASVSAGSTEKLGYVVENGIIVVATEDSLPRKMVTRVYDVTDLLGRPANYYSMPMGMGVGGMGMGGYGGPYRSRSGG
jgi:hypothetical protein